MRTIDGLTAAERAHYDEHGYVKLTGFAGQGDCERMLDRVVEITRAEAASGPPARRGGDGGRSATAGLVLPESNLAGRPGRPEELASKVFTLHRDEVFGGFAASPALTGLLAGLIGPGIDCFLSQFIFKNPGAWGQPWHQDSYYFAFEPARPVVGVSLAVTPATTSNGCLHVLPGSHRDPIHTHVPDRRPGANIGYVEIVDRDVSGAVAMPMDPGDLLVFDSHLVHRSSDNVTDGLRAAMTYHFAATGTRDLHPGVVNDFVTVR
ncbi:MAG TPA: phytanoyl-CoA dioxygenase family protein [Acidimicrobiales bacterium]|nr:phytanoyl-CoA dioxygenase family protein [Acidimicrobiales bacterium]